MYEDDIEKMYGKLPQKELKRNPDKKKGRDKTKFSNTYGKKEHMATNKFLPFIVESSTPKSIYKTLLSRSKGMNKALIASMFNLTLNVDIKLLRETAKALPEMGLEQLYHDMLQSYGDYRVDTETLDFFKNIHGYFPANQLWWDGKELGEFNNDDAMAFFCVCTLKPYVAEQYTEIDFSRIHLHETVLLDFAKYVSFSDDGEEMRFSNYHDLKTFVLYNCLLREQMEPNSKPPKICAKYS